MATFPSIAPDYGVQEDSEPKIQRVQFGDGAEARFSFGLNQDPKTWPLSWTNISNSEADQIKDFLNARAADRQSFDWLPADIRNLLSRTEELDNEYWTKFRASIVANATTNFNDLLTADKIVEDTTTAGHNVSSQSLSFEAGKPYTLSGYFKAAERTRIRLRLGNGGVPFPSSSAHQSGFDLTTGAVTSTGSSLFNSVISDVGSGWYRCSITATAQATGAEAAYALLAVDSTGSNSYAGNGTSGLFAWGIQLEQCGSATDYQSIGAEKVYKWFCDKWSRKLTAFNRWTVSATFRQVFEP